jgi:uncharacterized protein
MTLAAADEHYAKLSSRFGYRIATPEGLINQLGYRLLGAKSTAAAIDIFRTNTERYPDSANVYDSLGEALEAGGRLNEAKIAYARAYSIGTATNDRVTNIFKQNLDRVSAALAAETAK